jgi:hypothetical protein
MHPPSANQLTAVASFSLNYMIVSITILDDVSPP